MDTLKLLGMTCAPVDSGVEYKKVGADQSTIEDDCILLYTLKDAKFKS